MMNCTVHALVVPIVRKFDVALLAGTDGRVKVFANLTQAERAAADLRRRGVDCSAFQSPLSHRFLVRIQESVN